MHPAHLAAGRRPRRPSALSSTTWPRPSTRPGTGRSSTRPSTGSGPWAAAPAASARPTNAPGRSPAWSPTWWPAHGRGGRVRVLVAPDKFAGTLTAVEAAEAIARGWARHAPGDVLDLAPMADGGPGFLDVLHAALGGELLAVTVRGPFGEAVPAGVLRVGERAYVESAQACGLHLTGGRRAEEASTYGVGQLVAAAVETGASEIVVGLGGSGTNDGGAGALARPGRHRRRRARRRGWPAWPGITAVDLTSARAACRRRASRRRQRRRQPADRALRRHQDLRTPEGPRRRPPAGRRRAPGGVRGRHRPAYLPRAGGRRGRRPRLRPPRAGRGPAAGHRPGRGRRRPARPARGRPTSS